MEFSVSQEMAFFQSLLGRTTLDAVKGAKAGLMQLESEDIDDKSIQKVQEKISTNLKEIKTVFYGDVDKEPKSDLSIEKTITEILENDLLRFCIISLKSVEFETRRDIVTIVCFLLRRDLGPNQCSKYLSSNADIVEQLCKGYADVEIALSCGTILRDCIRHENLCLLLFNNDEILYPFFQHVQSPSFDVSSDAFTTFKMILTQHKDPAADYLEMNYDKFFGAYNDLIQSKNYVSMRQSIKLLGEILLDRKNFNVMIKYINSADNLKRMMLLLRGRSKTIQFEAFHVFKVFVANPDKSAPVLEILVRNKDKLIEFLSHFQEDKDEDEQFAEEKTILLTTLVRL